MKHGAAGPGLVPADLERHSIEIDRKNLRAALGSRSTEGKDSVRICVDGNARDGEGRRQFGGGGLGGEPRPDQLAALHRLRTDAERRVAA